MSILKAMRCASFGLGPVFHNTTLQAPSDDNNEPLGIIELDDNLADVEKPAEIPAGVYTAEVQGVETPTSQKGNKYFAIKLVVPPDELPADIRDDFEDGAVLYWNRNVVPNGRDRRALFNLRKLVEAMGLDSAVNQIDPNEWMGRKVRIRVVMGKWQGEDRAEIRAIEAAERAAPARGAGKGRGAAPVEEVADEAESTRRPSRRTAAGARAR